jgi:peptide/nickel transport system permease protein
MAELSESPEARSLTEEEILRRQEQLGEYRPEWQRTLQTITRNRSAQVGGVIVIIFLVTALLGRLEAPSAEHIMGTDEVGRDIAIRILHGAPVSLRVSVISTVISLFIGVFLGELSGFAGGIVDSIIMRLMDIILAFPALLLAIVIVAFLGPGLTNAMLAIAIVGTLGLGTAVVETAALGFLGLGQQPPYPEWGKMLAVAQRFLLQGSWWALVFPGIAIVLTVLGFNLLGDGLRDALDPRLAKAGVE